MKSKKGNVAVIAIIIVIVTITTAVITWLAVTKSQSPVQQSAVAQPVAKPVTQTQPITPTPEPTPTPSGCAKEGEKFSSVYKDEYPEHCCEGLTEWHSGMDTRMSIGSECYDTMMESGNPVGTCINCGNGVCEEMEDACNCPKDCKNGQNADYSSIKDFCEKGTNYLNDCDHNPKNELCQLCK